MKYTEAQPSNATQILEERVQKYLNDQFEEERIRTVRKPTKWAVMHFEFFREILVSFDLHSNRSRKGGSSSKLRNLDQNKDEEIKIGQLSLRIDEKSNELDKRVWGFPINVTLTTFENLWEAIKATRMH
jgi:hypothetical protein